ncbi:hypothetical protein OHC33_004370 [Knufia fluminis]|uniref:Uncharacterized protein n=1 Tax=Knufia fluminis TaxID=191047 RepID=A0AAN8I4W9_9EURO|nr:hypothetical protein OHC33_004370 [Knufia fluminis]
MADDPDLSPDERPKKVVVLRLPPDVLERGTTTRTTQPRRDGLPRRKKLGRPRKVSLEAQHERAQSQTRSQQQQRQQPQKRFQPYPQDRTQQRDARENSEALRMWRDYQVAPLAYQEFDRSGRTLEDDCDLPPKDWNVTWGSDKQRDLIQGAWETLIRAEKKFGTRGRPAEQDQNPRQGRVVLNALQQPQQQQKAQTGHILMPQPVLPATSILNRNRQFTEPEGYGEPADSQPATSFLDRSERGVNEPHGYGFPTNNQPASYSTSFTVPTPYGFGHPHAHPPQHLQYGSPTTSQYQPGYAAYIAQPPDYRLVPTPSLAQRQVQAQTQMQTHPQAQAPSGLFRSSNPIMPTRQQQLQQPLQQQQLSYNTLPSLPPMATQPTTTTPDPSHHYTVNLVHNLNFPDPLLPPLDPATQLDYSYLIRNNLQDKENNYIPSELHLTGGCGELRQLAPTDFVNASNATNPQTTNDGDVMNVDNIPVDLPTLTETDLTLHQSTFNSTTKADKIPLPIPGFNAHFAHDRLLASIHTAADVMHRGRRGRARYRAEVAGQCALESHWREESRGRYIQANDGKYQTCFEDEDGKIVKEDVVGLGVRREGVWDEGRGVFEGVFGDDEEGVGEGVGGHWATREELVGEDVRRGGRVRREIERGMELADAWRVFEEGVAERETEGEYGLYVGGDDVVFEMVDVDEDFGEDGLGEYRHSEPQI